MSDSPESILTYQDKTPSIIDWALDYGIPPSTIVKRLTSGWPIDCAISEPVAVEPGEKLKDRPIVAAIRKLSETEPKQKIQFVRLAFRGEERSFNQWSEITGIKKATLRYRLNKGWSVSRALTEPVSKNNRHKSQKGHATSITPLTTNTTMIVFDR